MKEWAFSCKWKENATLISTEKKAGGNQEQYKHNSILTHRTRGNRQKQGGGTLLSRISDMLDKIIGALALNAVLLHMGMLNPQKRG